MSTIPIVYEDDSLIIINKPPGITVNKSDTTHGEITVQDWAEEYLDLTEEIKKLPKKEKTTEVIDYAMRDPKIEFLSRGGVVHRLDKETSGILLIAKTPVVFVALQNQFKERTIHKTYLALAHGIVHPVEGEIRVPVGRLPWNRKRFGIIPGGREAVTKYTTMQHYTLQLGKQKEQLTLLELYPETGRTHQIRVHLQYIRHPIFADFLYAGRKTAREDRKLLGRVFLHAFKISFQHPKTKKDVQYESPLPQDLQHVVETNLVPRVLK